MGHPGLKTEGSSGFMVLVRIVWHGSSEGSDAPDMTNSPFLPVNYPIRIRKQINVMIQDTNIKYFGGQRPELHYVIGLVTRLKPGSVHQGTEPGKYNDYTTEAAFSGQFFAK